MSKTVGQWALEMLDNVLHEGQPKTAAEWALEMLEEVVLAGLAKKDHRRKWLFKDIVPAVGLDAAITEGILHRLANKGLVTNGYYSWWGITSEGLDRATGRLQEE